MVERVEVGHLVLFFGVVEAGRFLREIFREDRRESLLLLSLREHMLLGSHLAGVGTLGGVLGVGVSGIACLAERLGLSASHWGLRLLNIVEG